jgi:hypothetical protein
MPESPLAPTAERRPAWRAAALAYRQARRDGASHHAAMDEAEASLRERWPELTAEVASADLASSRRGNGVTIICAHMLSHVLRAVFGTELPTSALQRFRPKSEGQLTFGERDREDRS